MKLTLLEGDAGALRVGYDCPCGCTPAVTYQRGGDVVAEGCCCGNHFAVGQGAAAGFTTKPGYRVESRAFQAPWSEPLEAAWLVGPSVHGATAGTDTRHADDGPADEHDPAVDLVCGMTIEPDAARAKALHSSYKGTDYFFCGKGCKLEFDEDPERYLDPSHVPSM